MAYHHRDRNAGTSSAGEPSDYGKALQPITQNSAASQSTKILRDLAPQLLHPRILSSPAFLNGAPPSVTLPSSSNPSELLSLSNPRNAFIALAKLRGTSSLNLVHSNSSNGGSRGRNAAAKSRPSTAAVTSTDLRIIEGIDRLLGLPIPSTSSAVARPAGGLPVLREDEAEEEQDAEDAAWGGPVTLLQGFTATMPAARARKQARRRRRAALSEKQLGIEAGVNELGLKERGDRARGLLTVDNSYVVESIESTPKKRVVKGKRRSSFMPSPLRNAKESQLAQQQTQEQAAGLQPIQDEAIEHMTKPELEAEIKEIGQDKVALGVRRRLVMKDLSELEKKIKKLESMKDELGQRLLDLKEEELELDDELEGVQDRLAQLNARQSGRAVSTTSSRRRKGPAFLPSEHDQLPANVAFMTLASSDPATSTASVMSLDFSEPYGLLVASYSAPIQSYHSSNSKGQVSVYDLTDGQELARLEGHDGLVKALLVEGDMTITGGEDGKIALWDLTKAVEDGLPHDRRDSNFVGSRARSGLDAEEDVFFSSAPSSTSGRRAGHANGTSSGRASHHSGDEDDDPEFPRLPSPKPVESDEEEQTASASRLKLLEGHSKAVTCLSYEDSSLVSGSSDKTLRLWDLNTGQCVVTMDILWAISNPLPFDADIEEATPAPDDRAQMSKSVNLPPSPVQYHQDADFPWHASASPSYMTPRTKKTSLSGLRRLSSQAYGLSTLAGSLPNSPSTPTATLANFNFTQATPPFADGSWDVYSDFVGGLQLWTYALASGSADGCVRMWDTRTGQSVRSLIGHTSPVTCLQFDNLHLVSGSLDKTVRVWDLRTGRTIETLRYEGPVTSLQFDSRRILVAGGTNNVQVFNRTTLQQTELVVNGHTAPVERLRFMDRYLATGGKDSMVKLWSLN